MLLFTGKAFDSAFHAKRIIIIIFIIIIIIIIIITINIINELTQSKTVLENIVEIKPQPVATDFKNLSHYSRHCCSCCNTTLFQSIIKLFGYST